MCKVNVNKIIYFLNKFLEYMQESQHKELIKSLLKLYETEDQDQKKWSNLAGDLTIEGEKYVSHLKNPPIHQGDGKKYREEILKHRSDVICLGLCKVASYAARCTELFKDQNTYWCDIFSDNLATCRFIDKCERLFGKYQDVI